MSTTLAPLCTLTHEALDLTANAGFLFINVRRRTDNLLTDAYVGGVALAMSVCLIFRFRGRTSFAIRSHESTGDFQSATLKGIMMNKLMSIGLMAALSGTGMVALAQAPTPKPAPTQQTAPTTDPRTQTPPKAETQRDTAAAKQATPATPSSKDAMTQHLELQAMDVNKDGLVSKQEYMSHYEGAYGKIKKDTAGMISLKDFASTSPIATAR